jgi:hypothetical protein
MAKEEKDLDKLSRFRVINQAIILDSGIKVYPYREGQNRNKQIFSWEADIVEITEREARNIGIDGEVAGGAEAFLQRVYDTVRVRMRGVSKTKPTPKEKTTRNR